MNTPIIWRLRGQRLLHYEFGSTPAVAMITIIIIIIMNIQNNLVMTMALSPQQQQQEQRRQLPPTSPKNGNNNNAPLSIEEELGCSPTLSVLKSSFFPSPSASTTSINEQQQQQLVYFDPLQLATDTNFARYREAELKHGRLSMLSVVVLSARTYWNELFSSSTTTTATTTIVDISSDGIIENGVNGVAQTETDPDRMIIPSIYTTIVEEDSWRTIDWVGFILFCGILEVLVYVQISPQDLPGDYGWGYFGERNKGKHEDALVSELENGRLAMLTMLYYAINDFYDIYSCLMRL